MPPSFPLITSQLLHNKAEIKATEERTKERMNESTIMPLLIEIGF